MAWYEDSIHLIRRLHRHGMLPHHSHVPSVLRSSGPSDPTSPWVRLVSHARVSSTCFSSTIQPFSFSLSSLPPSSFFILLFFSRLPPTIFGRAFIHFYASHHFEHSLLITKFHTIYTLDATRPPSFHSLLFFFLPPTFFCLHLFLLCTTFFRAFLLPPISFLCTFLQPTLSISALPLISSQTAWSFFFSLLLHSSSFTASPFR